MIERFWAKVDKTDTCWMWRAGVNSKGYGNFWAKGKTVEAHRWLWIYLEGPIAPGLCVCHTCDTPLCVNPSHLFLGTPNDNIQDCKKKQRLNRPKGEVHSQAILTEGQVKEIRSLYSKGAHSASELGRLFQVAARTVRHILKGTRWGHL